jgi:RNA polymerase sigma factor (sigma-70 family)
MSGEREARIRALLPLVKQIARRVQRMVPGADLDDLVGDGSLGLIRAVDGYDPVHGVPLEQYARRIVAGAMLNGIRRLDPVSERVRRTMRVAENARYALAHELGTLPTLQHMEQRLPALARARVEAHRGTPLSLDAPFPAGERLELDRGGDPQELVVAAADRERIRGAVAALSPRQREIVLAHYYRERSLRSLGAPLGISPQRVSQLLLAAIRRVLAVLATA